MYFCFCIVIKGYRNSSEKAVSYFIIKMGGIVVAKFTYLITWHGTESLAYKIPTKYSYAIHSW
jgi:hypothetical protein